METERSPDTEGAGADRAQSERDDDLVVLEGLEAEFTDLESELARVEQSRNEGPAEPGT